MSIIPELHDTAVDQHGVSTCPDFKKGNIKWVLCTFLEKGFKLMLTVVDGGPQHL